MALRGFKQLLAASPKRMLAGLKSTGVPPEAGGSTEPRMMMRQRMQKESAEKEMGTAKSLIRRWR